MIRNTPARRAALAQYAMPAAPAPEPLSPEAHELVLIAENTAALYEARLAIRRRLARRIARSDFDPARAAAAYRPLADAAARDLRRVVGGPLTAPRHRAAAALALWTEDAAEFSENRWNLLDEAEI